MRIQFKTALMAHRGGSLEFVENTLPAFRHAANQLAVDLLELDCQLTKDGIPVIFHDDTLQRMCGEQYANKSVRDFNYSELPLLQITENLRSELTSSDNANRTINVLTLIESSEEYRRIPTLQQLFDEFPSYPMQIDVKRGPEELVVKVGQMIASTNRQQFTVWGSFRRDVNRMCFRHFRDQIPIFYDMPAALFSFCMWAVGLWPVYQWWYSKENYRRYSCLILPNISFFMRKGWFGSLNRLGIPVILFGVPGGSIHKWDQFETARAAGANGICSDKPSLLKVFLKNYPLAPIPAEENKKTL